jgi:hypothetical protein
MLVTPGYTLRLQPFGGPMAVMGNNAEAYINTKPLGNGRFGARAEVWVTLQNGRECPSTTAYALWDQVVD